MDFAVTAGFFTAVFAAIGYVAKLAVEWIQGLVAEHRHRQSQLVQLESLLRASFSTYLTQCDHRDRLAEMIEQRTKKKLVGGEASYDQYFADSYETLVASEMELHTIIRAYTIYAMRPVNESLLNWIREDTYFKAQGGTGPLGILAGGLANLEAHLFLWQAKYQAWIPEFKSHALVYLADEKDHGVGFPTGIDDLIPAARTILDSSTLGRLQRYSDRLGA